VEAYIREIDTQYIHIRYVLLTLHIAVISLLDLCTRLWLFPILWYSNTVSGLFWSKWEEGLEMIKLHMYILRSQDGTLKKSWQVSCQVLNLTILWRRQVWAWYRHLLWLQPWWRATAVTGSEVCSLLYL